MNSHELVGVVDAGGEPGVELFLGDHLCHLILLCPDIVAVSVPVVVPGAPGEEPSGQIFLSLGGIPGVALGEHTGAYAVGPCIFLGLQLGYDDGSGPGGGNHVRVSSGLVVGGHEPSDSIASRSNLASSSAERHLSLVT